MQDNWTVGSRFKVNAGARWDANSSASGDAVWPRAVVSYDVRPNSTKLTAGIGVFADKPLLSPPVFPERQARREMLYDESGQPPVVATVHEPTAGPLATPRTTWNVQLDQTLKGGWMARVAFQERLGRRNDGAALDPRGRRRVSWC